MVASSTTFEKRCGLAAYYDAIQRRDGEANPAPLIGPWKPDVVMAVREAVRRAFEAGEVRGISVTKLSQTAAGEERTNQLKGNVAADFLADHLSGHSETLKIEPLRGPGYPDKRLTLTDTGFVCGFEVKATSNWNSKDSNRRVLTSSPVKLLSAINRGELPAPPCHLLGSILYDRALGTVSGLRLDFLEPDSLIAVRLEASTSHSLLSQGSHVSEVI